MLLHDIKEGISKRIIIRNDNAMKEKLSRKIHTCGCSAIKNNATNLRDGFNEKLEKEWVLLPTSSPRSAISHKLSALHHRIEEDIINARGSHCA
jgi:hypothetical protein